MPETKHTPGPWFLNLENAVVNPMLDVIIGHVEYLDDVDEARANARLIAAAPELLQALQGLMPVVNRIMHISGETWDLDDEEAVQEARAVIAKAISAK